MDLWFSEFHAPDVKLSIRVDKHIFSQHSDVQRIDVFESKEFGRILTLDGQIMLTERDEFIYAEMITHVPMAVHKNAKDILVIGAGDGGVIRELTRYDRVQHIDLVEMDPLVVEVCRKFLPENAYRFDDERVSLYHENVLKFLRKCENQYDLIIVDSNDPFGAGESLFTKEFYGNCYKALREHGIMVNQLVGFMCLKFVFYGLSRITSGTLFGDFNVASFKSSIWYYYLPNGLQQWAFVYLIFGLFVPILISIILNKICHIAHSSIFKKV